MEIWKNLNNEYGSQYQVSNMGNIRSKLFVDSWKRERKSKVLKPNKDKGGYLRVRLSINYVKKSFRIHRLVAEVFLPNINNLPQVNHINGIKTDNRVVNLEWCNNSYNQLHAIKNNLRVTKIGKESPKFKGSILVLDKEGNLIDELFGNADMKNKGYDYRNVNAVVNNKRNSYKGLIFKRNEKI